MNADYPKLLDAVFEMNSAGDGTSFSAAVVSGVKRFIEADVADFQALDLTRKRIAAHMSPEGFFTAEEITFYTAHSSEHPLNIYYANHADRSAKRISDVTDDTRWRASKLYRTCLRRTNMRHTIGVPVTIDNNILVAVSLSRRSPDFTREDCELLDAFAPHLRLAWQRHPSPWADQQEWEDRRRLRSLGLSSRESEVLYWMTQGKVNREVALILAISLTTVQEHVAKILQKLDVENRHAATVQALALLRTPASSLSD
jgi:DNA-binding CsgD family transcriptional regulator/GAF domain-containing protein